MPGGAGRPVGGRGGGIRGAGGTIEYPCEWAKGLEEGKKKIKGTRDLLYLYFHRPAPRLKGSFYFSKLMQKLSMEEAVFVKIRAPKKRDKRIKELLERYKVKRLPYAIIADAYGNPLYRGASYTKPRTLQKQLALARKKREKLYARLEKTVEKVKDYCRKRKYNYAAREIFKVKKQKLKGIPAVKKLYVLWDKIDRYLAKKLRKILRKSCPEEEKAALLRKLKGLAYRELPVYQKIKEALAELRSPKVARS